MKLSQYQLVFVAVFLVGALLIASPAIGLFVTFPMGTPFSEIYVLGSDQKFAASLYNATLGQPFTLYVGVGNHEEHSTYYAVDVKLRNATEPLPNATAGTVAGLPTLYSERFVCQNDQAIQKQLNFTITDLSIDNNQTVLRSININGDTFQINHPSAWDNATNTFYYELIFELSAFNTQSGSMVFTGRYSTQQLNVTSTSTP